MNKLILATYFHQFHQHAYAELLFTKMPFHSTSISLTFLRLTDSLILAWSVFNFYAVRFTLYAEHKKSCKKLKAVHKKMVKLTLGGAQKPA